MRVTETGHDVIYSECPITTTTQSIIRVNGSQAMQEMHGPKLFHTKPNKCGMIMGGGEHRRRDLGIR